MILWRPLLDAIGVRWIDRGRNTARNHVNIACPWCGTNDPSYHLGINEADGAYYCLRSQPPHAGRSTPFLLIKLGVAPSQIEGLLREFSDGETALRSERFRDPTDWEKFPAAADHPAALQYLRSRGIEPPAVVARRYDLRFTTVGRNSWRILMPLHLNTAVVGWTGRALSKRAEPRYLTNDPTGAALYIPIYPTGDTHTVQLLEGPFDALAVSDAVAPEVIGIGLLGLDLSQQKLRHLADVIGLAAPGVSMLITRDEDQSWLATEIFKEALAREMACPYRGEFDLFQYPLPDGVKDAGEMTRAEIQAWHRGDRNGLRAGMARRL